MTADIECSCGETFQVDASLAGSRLPCPNCGQMHSLVRSREDGASALDAPAGTVPPEPPGDRNVVSAPVVGAILAVLVICLALLWALLAGSEGTGDGMGRGQGTGIGDGIGAGEGNGAGTGTGNSGDGPGAGTAGDGTGQAGGPDRSGSAAATQPTGTGQPTTQPVVRDVRIVRLPTVLEGDKKAALPPPPTGPPSGTSGTSGGGSTGRSNVGEDPGARGDISFTLVWGYSIGRQGRDMRGGPDVDIWVMDPRGQVLSTSREGFALGPTPDGGRIDHDDLGGWGTGNGGGPERVYWPKGRAPAGKYTYGIVWYEGIGSANYTVKVYIGNTPHITKTGRVVAAQRRRRITLGTVEARP